MNVLSRDQQIQVIGALTEGLSIRAIERMTGIHRGRQHLRQVLVFNLNFDIGPRQSATLHVPAKAVRAAIVAQQWGNEHEEFWP